jgi:ABC-type protease/lipase transport system fused ATPase/permease subunit
MSANGHWLVTVQVCFSLLSAIGNLIEINGSLSILNVYVQLLPDQSIECFVTAAICVGPHLAHIGLPNIVSGRREHHQEQQVVRLRSPHM